MSAAEIRDLHKLVFVALRCERSVFESFSVVYGRESMPRPAAVLLDHAVAASSRLSPIAATPYALPI